MFIRSQAIKDFSQLLQDKTQTSLKLWVVAVCGDKKIPSTNNLSCTAIENGRELTSS